MPDPLAIYAAVIGTAAAAGALWNIYDRTVRELPRLKVSCSQATIAMTGLTKFALGGPLQHEKKIIMVKATNIGRRIVTVQEAGIVLKNRAKVVFSGLGNDVPKEIGPGQPHSIWMHVTALSESFNDAPPAYPYFRDSEGRMYKGSFDELFWNWHRQERMKR